MTIHVTDGQTVRRHTRPTPRYVRASLRKNLAKILTTVNRDPIAIACIIPYCECL